MPSEEAILIHIRDNIQAARGFVEGLSYVDFKNSPLHFYTVTRALEIVSEAARRLPTNLRIGTLVYHGGRSWVSATCSGMSMTTFTKA